MTRTKTIAALIASCTVWVGVIAATASAELEQGTAHVAAVSAAAWPGVAEGYHGDYTDSSLAAWDCAHGRTPSGYGIEGALTQCPTRQAYTDASGTAWAWVSAEAGFEPVGAN